MTVQPQQSDATDRSSATLESWKEIASYLGRSVRAVQMWERDERLPIHRHQHDKQGTVFAYRSELDTWLRGRTQKPATEEVKPRSDKRFVTWIAAAGVLAILAAITWWISRDSSSARATSLEFGTRDWLLLAALENGSGENVFNGSIEYLLERELRDSQLIKVASRERVADVLRLMRRDPQSRVDRTMAREIAMRDGSIQALLIPRMERLGSTYVLGLDIVETRTGNHVAKFSAKARTHDEVAEAVTKLANEVRPALGDRPAATNHDRLERVTTPSLRALQLFTEADQVIAYGGDNVTAEKLLRAAIAEDPDFASAYMHLAFALSNQRKPAADYLPHAERALALAHTATERERYFILGGHASMNNKLGEAVSHYQKLVQRYPDHFWGTSNLGNLLHFRLGRHRDAAPYRIRLAELRPNQFGVLFAAAESLYAWSDTPDEARRYFARAAELASPIDEERMSNHVALARLHPAHLAWLAGDVKAASAELEKWTARARAIGGAHGDRLLEHIANFEFAIGRADRARAIAASSDISPSRARMSANLAFWSGDCRTVRAAFEVLLEEPGARAPNHVLRMMQCGLRDPAKRIVSLWPASSPHRKVVLGVAALQEGQRANGLMLIEEGFRSFDDVGARDIAFYLSSAGVLAAAYDQAGQIDRAIPVLEEASKHRRTIFFAGRVAWVEVRRDLARLYRKAGREQEATGVEDELRRMTIGSRPA